MAGFTEVIDGRFIDSAPLIHSHDSLGELLHGFQQHIRFRVLHIEIVVIIDAAQREII